MNPEIDRRSLYRGHVLSCHPEVQDDGRFQARVAITSVGSGTHLSQRFLDLEVCDTREVALAKATRAGRAWVDRECAARSLAPRLRISLPMRPIDG